jgi:hypothetical protein
MSGVCSLTQNTESSAPSPQPPQASGDQPTAIDLCNEYLFTFAVSIVLADFVVYFWPGSPLTQGLQTHPKFYDLPLLFGLLVLFCGNFNFYKRLIEPRGETPAAALYSLLGMLAMSSLPILMLLDPLLPYRYLILGCYSILVMIKNEQLKRRFRLEPLGSRFRSWTLRSIYHCVAALAAGALYYYLFERFPAQHLWLTLIFNLLFVSVITARFILDQGNVGVSAKA